MRRLVVPVALAVLCLTGCQSSTQPPPADDAGIVAISASPTPSPTPTPTPTETPTPVVAIRPDLRTSTNCSVAAGKYPTMTKGVRFTAASTVVNKGNIGATVLVKATWVGLSTVHRGQTIAVGYGKKVKVTFNAPTSKGGAKAFHGNGAGRCEVTVKVLSFRGRPKPTK